LKGKISQSLLENALNFASKFDIINRDETEIILYAKKLLLFNSGNAWEKHNGIYCGIYAA